MGSVFGGYSAPVEQLESGGWAKHIVVTAVRFGIQEMPTVIF